MSEKVGKKSILDFFKPKGSKLKKGEELVVHVKTEIQDLDISEGNGSEENNVIEQVVPSPASPPQPPSPSPAGHYGSRPTRACANRAKLAGYGALEVTSSSDDDFIESRKGSRKRGRPSKNGGNKKGTQATLSKNGAIIRTKQKDQETEPKSKKKVKLDPETEAFLRSGVPDVIKKARAKSMENRSKRRQIDSDSDDEIIVEKVKEKRKTLDPETIAFLQSGVPSSIAKAKQVVDKRKAEDDFLSNMGFFPKTSHTTSNEIQEDTHLVTPIIPIPFPFLTSSANLNENDNRAEQNLDLSSFPSFVYSALTTNFSCFSSQDSDLELPVGLCCDDSPVTITIRSKNRKSNGIRNAKGPSNENDDPSQVENTLPWIDLMKVTNAKNLVVDKNALETLTRWLKKWRKDIKDDGGTSRKIETKRKRGGNSSDSDFVTSNEEDGDMKRKSVLLTGSSGCGKTAAVYVLAKHYEFEVVEVNFSSRRSGREVLQRVEEAVLSHRLKASKNCLLLFKDIDLLDQEEDEGFFSAVAQLITTAVRPIVMTSSLPGYFLLDSKLDKKDPLRISFTMPKPGVIVDNILKPILSSTRNQIRGSENETQVDKWLDSIVRHCGCDIRQCINQLQLLLSTTCSSPTDRTEDTKGFNLSNQVIHLHSSPFQRHLIDLNFPRQSLSGDCSNGLMSSQESNGDDVIGLTVSSRNKRCLAQIREIGNNLEIFSDLDWISRISGSCPTRNVNIYGDVEEATWHWNHVSGMRSPFFNRLSYTMDGSRRKSDLRSIRKLVLESDAEVDKCLEIDELNDEIGQYLDLPSVGIGTNWESCAAVRTIIKNNMVESVTGRNQKRNGRMASYFNRVDRSLKERITNTLGFKETLNAVKLS